MNFDNTYFSVQLTGGYKFQCLCCLLPLNAVIKQLNHENDVAACNTLDAFLHQVDAKETWTINMHSHFRSE